MNAVQRVIAVVYWWLIFLNRPRAKRAAAQIVRFRIRAGI